MKTLIAVPCMDMLHTPFACALLSQPPLPGQTEITFCANSLIYDARNQLAEKAVREGFDRVLWLDSDVTFRPDFSARLAAHLDAGLEFVTGLYMTRKSPLRPCIFSKLTLDPPATEFYDHYPVDSLFEIDACGFGGVMMTTDLLVRVAEAYAAPFTPISGIGEDLSFCYRARAVGAKLYCDSRIKMGHIGFREITEATYFERIRNEENKHSNENTYEGSGRAAAAPEPGLAG